MPVEGVHASPLPKLNISTSSLPTTDDTQLMDKSNSSHTNGVDSLTASFWQHTSLSDKEQASPKLQYSRRRLSSNDNAVIPMDIDHRSTPPSTNFIMKDFLPPTDRTTLRGKRLDEPDDHTSSTKYDGSTKSKEYTALAPQESSTPFDLHTINSIPCASNSTCATDQFHSPPPNTNGVKLKRHSATKPKLLSTTSSKPTISKPSTSPSQAKPISAIELMTRLENEKRQKSGETMLLIDLRDINEYNEDTIIGAINVNLPTLLIKRFKRNAMSTFKMQNFITTAEGKEFYAARENLNSGGAIVVFDQTMDETDPDLYAWTLLAILEKVGLDDVNPSLNTTSLNIQVFWLKGGYDVFRQFDVNGDHRSVPGAFITALNTTTTGDSHSVDGIKLDANLLSRPAPMLSRSTTIPSSAPMNQSSNLQRRASLFSLDTGAARARREHSNRILRQASQRAASRAAATSVPESLTTSPESMVGIEERKDDGMESLIDSARHSSASSGRQWSARSKDGGPDSAATQDSGFYTSSTVNSAASELPLPPYVNEWKDSDLDDMSEDIMSSDSPPVSYEETQFVVSEIVPGFLFVGPEIISPEHVQILQEKAVRRILNMAEECDDDVPGLQDAFIYKKIPARDTVDMRNVSSTFTGAVKFIEDSKRLHEPIYVHCRAGKSRSVTAILAYLILSERWTLKRAYRHVTKARPNMSPNIGFVAELMKLEGRVHGMVSGIDSSDPSSMPLPSPKLKQDLKKLKQEWENTVN